MVLTPRPFPHLEGNDIALDQGMVHSAPQLAEVWEHPKPHPCDEALILSNKPLNLPAAT